MYRVIGGYIVNDITGERTPLYGVQGRPSRYGAPKTTLTGSRDPAVQMQIQRDREDKRRHEQARTDALREAARVRKEAQAQRAHQERMARLERFDRLNEAQRAREGNERERQYARHAGRGALSMLMSPGAAGTAPADEDPTVVRGGAQGGDVVPAGTPTGALVPNARDPMNDPDLLRNLVDAYRNLSRVPVQPEFADYPRSGRALIDRFRIAYHGDDAIRRAQQRAVQAQEGMPVSPREVLGYQGQQPEGALGALPRRSDVGEGFEAPQPEMVRVADTLMQQAIDVLPKGHPNRIRLLQLKAAIEDPGTPDWFKERLALQYVEMLAAGQPAPKREWVKGVDAQGQPYAGVFSPTEGMRQWIPGQVDPDTGLAGPGHFSELAPY